MLTVEQIKLMKEIPPSPSTKLTVLEVGPIEIDHGKKRFHAILADNTGAISATIYNDKEHDKFMVGFGVTLLNILCKTSYIGVTVRTEVAMSPPVDVPDAIKEAAPRLPGSRVKSIEDALASPEKTVLSIKGKVSQVRSPLKKTIREGDMSFQDIVLKDQTGTIKVALWDNLVGSCSKGQLVSIEKCRVKIFKEEKKLTTTAYSTTEVFTTQDELFDVSSDEDIDETDNAPHSEMPSGTVEGIFDVHPYHSCPVASCNNVKMIEMDSSSEEDAQKRECRICRGTYTLSSCNRFLRAIILLKTHLETKKVAIFYPQIKKLFESRGLDSSIELDKSTMLRKMMALIPIDIKYRIVNNTIREVVCKRVCN